MKNIFKPPAAKEPFSSDLKTVNKKFNFLRNQVFIVSILGYMMYYFTRKSVDITGSHLMETGGLSTYNYALMGMFFSITYGCSKFIIGGFADRSSGRIVMTMGLLVSAILNIALGGVIQIGNGQITIAPLVVMIIILTALGIFQGMGWPATARMMAHWFTDKERSPRLAIWNSGQGLGAAFAPLIIIPLIELIDPGGTIYGLYYWVPSIIALIFLPLVFWGLRDRPEAEGLPTVEKWKGITENAKEKTELKIKEIFVKYILKNKYVWILAFANIWVYVLRQGMSSWAIKIADEMHGIKLKDSKWLWSFFEWSGIAGGIFAAYGARYLFQNRKAPLMIFGLIIGIGGLVIFQNAPRGNISVLITAIIVAGFGVYMPQAMIGATAIELTNKKAAATASGLTGLFGYFGDAVMSKPVVAGIAGNGNWDNVFYYFYACAIIAIIALAFLWTKNQDNKVI